MAVKTSTPMNMNSLKHEEIEAQYLEELKENACAAAGTGEFAIWHFNPELGADE